jgi:predicted MFS family arabinose efflux permease
MRAVREFDRSDVVAALAIGSIGLLMLGAQPVVLGELVERKVISLEGVGIVAMGEIIAIGVGVALGDALLATTRMRLVTIVAAMITALFDFGSLALSSDLAFVVERAFAGLGEGVLMWATTCVIVRSSAPERLAGAFLVAQTLAQAAVAAVLATVIVPRFGWQGAFAALGLLSAAAALVAPLLPASLDPLKADGAPRLSVSPAVVLTLAIIFCEMATLGALWAFLEPLGTRAGLDSQTAQTIVSGVLVMQVIGGLTATALAERLPPGRTLAAAAIVLGAITLTIGVAPGPAPIRFAVLCAAFGFVWLFMMPFHIGLALRVDPAGQVAMLAPAAQLTGSAFGPLVVSLIVVGDDAGPAPFVSAAFALVALAGLVALALMQRPENAALAADSAGDK